ncbi:MAG: hypothetical protein KAH14_09620 [Clostridiales bacterium]|nr:hypothetical protein [Clostridiales bacterium]
MTTDNNKMSLKLSIKPSWSIINNIETECSKLLESCNLNEETIETTLMCINELIENAIKYGTESSDTKNIDFTLSIENNIIIIKISNEIKTKNNISALIEHIDKINDCDDPGKLYKNRLMELMEVNQPGISQLGLYRIAYEGKFSLNYIYKNKKITITAKKEILSST